MNRIICWLYFFDACLLIVLIMFGVKYIKRKRRINKWTVDTMNYINDKTTCKYYNNLCGKYDKEKSDNNE